MTDAIASATDEEPGMWIRIYKHGDDKLMLSPARFPTREAAMKATGPIGQLLGVIDLEWVGVPALLARDAAQRAEIERLRKALEAMREAAADLAESYDVHNQKRQVAKAIAKAIRLLPVFADTALETKAMTEDQIKHMVDRFLMWKLPENFRPDDGISFKPYYNQNSPWPMKHEPMGTNLFDATQATEMVRFMIEGIPKP